MKIKEEWLQTNGKYQCPHCEKQYSRKGICSHIWRSHTDEGKNLKPTQGKTSWAKGLTKDTDLRLREAGKKISEKNKGKNNPFYGKTVSNEKRKQISNSMKIAHAEGRANNWQDSKKYNNSSYPELFFEKVIKNEFNDKNYIREFRVGPYAIDFAWVDKKLAIEIDGKQHEYPEHQQRDIRKDEFLESEGWKILRIKWTTMFHDTKNSIKLAKDFIH